VNRCTRIQHHLGTTHPTLKKSKEGKSRNRIERGTASQLGSPENNYKQGNFYPSLLGEGDERMDEVNRFNIIGIKYFDKGYERFSYKELVEAPVSAISGVSETDATDLSRALKIRTVGDLARNKYVKTAQAITAFSNISTEVLDKRFESKEFKKLRKLPVSAISGISEKSGALLKKALGVDTIEELAENKYVKIAQIVSVIAALESML